ncbi:MAG TPA: hypothetical protein PK441_07410, partial [Burkholderiaceae bacterium]|nr:hypothetical protein [Burkholderiaceae bacterium]
MAQTLNRCDRQLDVNQVISFAIGGMGGPPLKCTRFVRTAVRAATGCRRGLVRSARPRTHPSILVGNRPISAHASLVALNVSCRRGEEWLFRDFSFSIQPGELVWLRGQNGSGKTSLLR